MAGTDIAKLKQLKIAIVPGTGRMGSALARHYALSGFKVVIGSRDAQKAKSLAQEMRSQFSEEGAEKLPHIEGGTNQEAADKADVVFWCIMVSLLHNSCCLSGLQAYRIAHRTLLMKAGGQHEIWRKAGAETLGRKLDILHSAVRRTTCTYCAMAKYHVPWCPSHSRPAGAHTGLHPTCACLE